MPNPHSANPANPAPSLSTMSKCSVGTALALAAPWMSTNCARMNLTSLSLRNCFASAGVMRVSCTSRLIRFVVAVQFRVELLQAGGIAAQLDGDPEQRLPQVSPVCPVAPDAKAGRASWLRHIDHSHADAGHHRERDSVLLPRCRKEIDAAGLREHFAHRLPAQHQCSILPQHRVHTRSRCGELALDARCHAAVQSVLE